MTLYVYAYDDYGARTYFTVSKIPKVAQQDRQTLESYLRDIARKKLGVSRIKCHIGIYRDEKFDQAHLPSNIYKKGHWRSYTTTD